MIWIREWYRKGKTGMCFGCIFKINPMEFSENWIIEYETDKDNVTVFTVCI